MRDHRRIVRRRVGRNVQRLRLLRGLSQERLAERVGNSSKHMGQIERGEVNVGLDVLSEVAAALAVDLRDLFVGASPARRSSEPKVYLLTENDLQNLERVLRRVRAARPPRSASRRRPRPASSAPT